MHHQPFSRDVNHSDLVGILEFIYNGEVSIEQDCLPGFLAVAETLRIRGLTGEVCHLFYLSLYFNSLLVFFMQGLNDCRESPESEADTRLEVQSSQSVEHQSEAAPVVGEHEIAEVDIRGTVGETEHCNEQ